MKRITIPKQEFLNVLRKEAISFIDRGGDTYSFTIKLSSSVEFYDGEVKEIKSHMKHGRTVR